MAMELIWFACAAAVILLPGIWLARGCLLGENLVERVATGASLGIALAVYLASAASHVDLRGFYILWPAVAIVSAIVCLRSLRKRSENSDAAAQVWVGLILAAVGVIQYAIALPRELPAGFLDPRFHLILARQIQLTHHAIDRWPFAGVGLNYPIGSHVLVSVMSDFSGLPVHTVFKDLIPLLDVLTTAQIYVLARRVSGQSIVGVYSAAIYGLWAWDGGIDYFRWGGLPNQLGMLMFIAMLSIWLGRKSYARIGAMWVCCAAMILVHHHVMVVGGVILLLLIVWQMVAGKAWKDLAGACLGGVVIDLFFVVPYLMKASSFHSTGILSTGEPALSVSSIPKSLGYAISVVGLIGITLCIAKRIPRHPLLMVAPVALLVMYVCGEYVIPMIVGSGETGAFLTPSRFLSDLNYFLAIFAGCAVWFFQSRLRFATAIALIVLLFGALLDWQNWVDMAVRLYEPPKGFMAACTWIGENTPDSTVVVDPDNWTSTWTTYLCWRQGAVVPMPISEPVADYHRAAAWIPDVLSGQRKPEPADLVIVAIQDSRSYTGGPILWSDGSGYAVVQEWPTTTSSSSGADTPGPKPPGLQPNSGPTSR
jgi:hypothetical protein